MTYRSILASLALSSALVSFPCDSSAAPRVVDRVAALVNEEMIPLSEIYSRAMPQLMQMQQMGKATAESRKEVLKMALEECIADRLLAAEQKAYGIEVTEAEIDAAIEDVRRQNHMEPAMFEKALQSQGLTMEKYREKLKTDLASMRLVNFKVRSKIKVSDEDIRTEYEKMVRESKADFEVHARHIVFQVAKDASPEDEEKGRSEAADIARRAREGEDFVELAKKYSQSASRDSGGDLGFFKRGDMVAAFESVAFNLPVGSVSDPVRTPFGWHVIKVEERRDLAIPSLDTLRPKIVDRLSREQMQHMTRQYVAELRAKAEVDVKVDDLK